MYLRFFSKKLKERALVLDIIIVTESFFKYIYKGNFEADMLLFGL